MYRTNLSELVKDLHYVQGLARGTKNSSVKMIYVNIIQHLRKKIGLLKLLAAVGLCFVIMFFQGCQTVNGISKDIRTIADSVDNSIVDK